MFFFSEGEPGEGYCISAVASRHILAGRSLCLVKNWECCKPTYVSVLRSRHSHV